MVRDVLPTPEVAEVESQDGLEVELVAGGPRHHEVELRELLPSESLVLEGPDVAAKDAALRPRPNGSKRSRANENEDGQTANEFSTSHDRPLYSLREAAFSTVSPSLKSTPSGKLATE